MPLVAKDLAAAIARALGRSRIPVALVVLGLAVHFALSALAEQYLVPTSSMAPTITPGDRIVVATAAYRLRSPLFSALLDRDAWPSIGDVVVFADPRGGDATLVKRVVALAGQTVALRRGVLQIDGRPQPLEALHDGRVVEHLGPVVHDAGGPDDQDYGPVKVPPGSVFVLGDNRAISFDSRFLGAIPRRLIRGRVLATLFHYDGAFDASRFLRLIR